MNMGYLYKKLTSILKCYRGLSGMRCEGSRDIKRQDSEAITSIPPYLPYTEAKEQGLIENGIKPLTEALLRVGFNPLVCCEGHFDLKNTDEPFYNSPYVGFSCEKSKEGFSDIELLFSVIEGFFGWSVKAWPHPEGYLLWSIRPDKTNEYRVLNQSKSLESFDRERLNEDLAIIQERIIAVFQINSFGLSHGSPLDKDKGY